MLFQRYLSIRRIMSVKEEVEISYERFCEVLDENPDKIEQFNLLTSVKYTKHDGTSLFRS